MNCTKTTHLIGFLSMLLLATPALAAVDIEFGQIFGVGKRASTIAPGDLNGDGSVDFAVANIFGDSVSVVLNDGEGNFSQISEVELENGLKHPVALSVGELNGDGREDIVAAQVQNIQSSIIPFNSSSVIFFFSNEDGTYTQMAKELRGVPSSVIVHDVDGNGRNDVIVGNNGETAFDFAQSGSIIQIDAGIDVLMNLGDQMFQDAQPIEIEGSVVNEVAFDYNGDGLEDIIAVNQGVPEIHPLTLSLSVRDPNVSLFRGTPTGILPFATIPLDYVPWSLDNADIDGDGLEDVAVTLVGKSDPNNFLSFTGQDASVDIFKNTGAGFTKDSEIPVTGVAYSVMAEDFDLDGDTDFAITAQEVIARPEGNELIPKLRLYENDGNGQFSETGILNLEEEPRYSTVADVDNDGDLDIAVLCTILDAEQPSKAVNGKVYIFINNAVTSIDHWLMY